MNTFSWLFAIIAETALKATLLLVLAWAAGRALKNRSSASRHLVRTCALCAVLLLPPLSSLLPAWNVKGVPPLRPAGTSASEETIPAPVVSSNHAATRTEVAAPPRTRRVREKPAAPAVAHVAAPQQNVPN